MDRREGAAQCRTLSGHGRSGVPGAICFRPTRKLPGSGLSKTTTAKNAVTAALSQAAVDRALRSVAHTMRPSVFGKLDIGCSAGKLRHDQCVAGRDPRELIGNAAEHSSPHPSVAPRAHDEQIRP